MMGYGFLLPPDPRRDPLQEEIKILQAQQGVSQKAPNGRFLPPGTLSKKAQMRSNPTLPTPETYRSALHDEIEASMLGADLPPEAPPTLPPDESAPTTEDTRADYVQAWRQKKRGGPTSLSSAPIPPVSAVLPPVSAPSPTPLAGDCEAAVFLRLHGKRLLVECTLQGPHPNQPHMHKIDPVEEGDTVFLGWWHQGE